MTAIPFPLSSAPGARPQEGAGRLINGFAVPAGEGARAPVRWQRTAGLRQLIDIAAHSHLRGAILVDATLIAVFDQRVYAVSESGGLFAAVNLGALSGSTPVIIARNRATPPNIVCVTDDGAFNLFTAAAPANFADIDLPQPNSVSEIKNYLAFTIGDGRIFTTGINDVSVSGGAFATAPGPLLRGVAFRGEFFAFGRTFTQPWTLVDTAPFPMQPSIGGGGVIPRGLVGGHAVAGHEDGWAGELIWVADNDTVVRLDGYRAVPISTDDVTRDIAAAVKAGDGALLEASVHMQGAHAIWRLTYPGRWTWEHNLSTGGWHERQSYGRNDCRGSVSLHAFDRWMSGDRTTGKLFEIDDACYREADQPLRFIIRSGAIAGFPARLGAPRLDFDFTAAVGQAGGEAPVQTDPTVLIRWSVDGGFSFGNAVPRKLGRQGEGAQTVTVLRGPASKGGKGLVVELEVADPVHTALLGGQIALQQRAA
jgi:hypothetical protein